MKLGILGSRGYPSTYGGFETFVRVLAPYLAAADHQVTVFGRRGAKRAQRRIRDGVTCVDTPGVESKSLSTLTHGLTGAAAARREHVESALVLNVANGFFVEALREAGIPVALNVDGLEWKRKKWNRLGQQTFLAGARKAARFSDVLIADSEAIADVWQEDFGVRPCFIPYGADVVNDVDPDPVHALGLEPRDYALVVARLAPENNVDLALDALDRIGNELPVVVVGSANYRLPLVDRLTKLQERPGFHWLGHVSDQRLLSSLWAHAGVYLHGHSAGGTNPALLQALGHGAPTLALDTVFNREVLASHTGSLYASHPELLAQAISATLNGAPAAVRGEVAQDIIRHHYSWPEVCAAYEHVMVRLGERKELRHPVYRPQAPLITPVGEPSY